MVRFPDGGSLSIRHYETLSFQRKADATDPPAGVGDGVLMSRAAWRVVGTFDERSPAGIAE